MEPLFQTQRIVRLQDIDAIGIVFFPRVLEYFSDAFVEYCFSKGLAVPELLAAGEVMVPVVHAEADYRSPLRFGDRVTVQIVRLAWGTTSLTLTYRVIGEETPSRLFAEGKTIHVCVSQRTFLAEPIPESLRVAFGSTDAEDA